MTAKLLDELSNRQERMHRKSKKLFREYLETKANELNLDYNILPKSIFSKNVVIGDLKNAKYILGAHYDTPPRLPAFLIRSTLFFNIFSILIVPIIFIIFITFEWNLVFAALIYLLLSLYILGIGIANKYNYNDNTSGVLTLLLLMNKLETNDVAYVFFDNEEKGLIGSLQLAFYMKKLRKNSPRKKVFINFDCVGRGESFGFASFNSKDIAQELIDIGNSEENNYEFMHRKPSVLEGSDHVSFKNWKSIGIMCYNKKAKKYKLNNIHSHKDKFINIENIDVLVNLIKKYIDKDVEANG